MSGRKRLTSSERRRRRLERVQAYNQRKRQAARIAASTQHSGLRTQDSALRTES